MQCEYNGGIQINSDGKHARRSSNVGYNVNIVLTRIVSSSNSNQDVNVSDLELVRSGQNNQTKL